MLKQENETLQSEIDRLKDEMSDTHKFKASQKMEKAEIIEQNESLKKQIA